jgi:hypothetical protein
MDPRACDDSEAQDGDPAKPRVAVCVSTPGAFLASEADATWRRAG